MSANLKNRRRFHRINFDGQVNLDCVNDRYDQYHSKNLSLGGIFVKGIFDLKTNENCSINFVQNALSNDKDLQASARVVWKDDEGIALEFTSMTFDSYAFLITTLIHGAEEPLAIREEMPSRCPFKITDV